MCNSSLLIFIEEFEDFGVATNQLARWVGTHERNYASLKGMSDMLRDDVDNWYYKKHDRWRRQNLGINVADGQRRISCSAAYTRIALARRDRKGCKHISTFPTVAENKRLK